MPEMKLCGKCKKKKPATADYFHKEKGNRDGLKGTCKECISWYDKIKKTKEYKESVVAKKKEELLSDTKKCVDCGEVFPKTSEYFTPRKDSLDGFRGQCRKCQAKKKSEYNFKNKDRIAEKHKIYYEQHKEAIAKYHAEYYLSNREYFLEKTKVYQKVKIESYRKYQNSYAKTHREPRRIWVQRYRAKKRNLPNTLTRWQWKWIKECFDNSCAYCGHESKMEQDHFIALNNGGEYTHNNIIPACRHCNPSKGDRDFFSWYPRQPFYSKAREQKIIKHLGYNKLHQQQLSLI